MTDTDQLSSGPGSLPFLAGGGEMGERTRAFDWSRTPLGALATWPQGLQAAVSICLNSRFPIVLWWGPELRLIYNDAWRPVLGQTKHPQALSSPGREVWPEIWHIIGPMLEGVLAHGKATWSDDQLLPLDRNGYPEEAYFTSIRQLAITYDITERKRAEAALRQSEQALKDADRRKDEFLATLAHELRNPLAPLRNGLQVMKLARGNAGATEQSRAMMERQLTQMVRLIDDLLDVSRISRDKITLQRRRVELAAVVQQAVETSRPLIEANEHHLAITVPPDPIYVDADVTRLAQVFSNLLNNAAKYTEPGGRITLHIGRQGSDAVVSVKDTGMGIPPHLLPRLFEMFTQFDRSLERSQGGLGIGLSLVKRLTEMHGGSVEARSEGSGMGSEFVVRLPVVLAVAQEVHGEAGDEKREPATRRRILVVDDNQDSAMSLAMMLKLMGNEVRAAHDGLEGVAVAAAFRPDVILLDIGMPKLNGYYACRRIREQPWAKNTVIVALTGWGQEDDKRRSQEAGFNSHLVKPVEPAALEKLLAELQSQTA